jgi:hypothetical protein
MMTDDFLTSLQQQARWNTAFHTFGSNHNTLIGLMVDWWVNSKAQREAIEGAPWFALKSQGGDGACDAILFEQGVCKGILEVEGGYVEKGAKEEPLKKYLYAMDRLEKYFLPNDPDWKDLEFGIFLAYPTSGNYMRSSLPAHTFAEKGATITKNHPGMQLILLTMDKRWDPQTKGVRARKNDSHDFYKGTPFRVSGVRIQDGEVKERQMLVEV